MAVRIGEAASDESGHITGGMPGDQTKNEVRITDYRPNFTVMLRCKDPVIADRIGEAMKQACINENVGYSQNDRYSMYLEMLKTGNILKITKPCNTDCSQLVASCCIVAGVKVSPYICTSTEIDALMNTGMFYKTTTIVPSKLQKGDILWRAGHTACVVEADCTAVTYSNTPKYVGRITKYCNVYAEPTKNTLYAPYPHLGKDNLVDVCDCVNDVYLVRIAAVYFGWVTEDCIAPVNETKKKGTVTTDLNVRSGPGASNSKVGLYKGGTVITILDEAYAPDGKKWLYTENGNVKGYVNASYVKI